MTLEGLVLMLLSISFVGTCVMFWMWYQFTKSYDISKEEELYYMEIEDEELDV